MREKHAYALALMFFLAAPPSQAGLPSHKDLTKALEPARTYPWARSQARQLLFEARDEPRWRDALEDEPKNRIVKQHWMQTMFGLWGAAHADPGVSSIPADMSERIRRFPEPPLLMQAFAPETNARR
jgi:hypothetical protein